MTVTLLLDTNQYLNLFRTVAGRSLLDSIEEQRDHIFLSKQIADEVFRNAVSTAQTYFDSIFREIDEEVKGQVPDHLLGIGDHELKHFRTTFADVREAKKKLRTIAQAALEQISRGEDDVSKRLSELFKRAIVPTPHELERARQRKEHGNPPGKPSDPLGDEVIWEQFLTHCSKIKVQKVWIASNDGDYCAVFDKQTHLNAMLYQELSKACGDKLTVYCFNNLVDAITHFGRNAGVRAEKVPSEADAEKIREELIQTQGKGVVEGLELLKWFRDHDPRFREHDPSGPSSSSTAPPKHNLF
jgi:hypothetical protein